MDFVCVDDMGMLLQPDFVTQKFQKLLEKYNLRPIRYHDLRHSCATILLYLGYTMKDVQTWLGHSNYQFPLYTARKKLEIPKPHSVHYSFQKPLC